MFSPKTLTTAVLLLLVTLWSGAAFAAESGFRNVVDSRGVTVKVPKEINRVITISDGMVEGVMIALGVQDKLTALGAIGFDKVSTYRFPSVKGGNIVYENGMKTVSLLDERLKTLPLIATWNTMPNYEKIASLEPDVMIIRVGSCWHWQNDEHVPQSIQRLESLGIPVVVLKSPNTYPQPKVSVYSNEIRIIGQIFGQEEKAKKLADFLWDQVNQIMALTKDVPEEEKPKVLLIGLSPKARESGAAGNVICRGNIESFFLEALVNARNVCPDDCSRKILSTEHILVLDPDAIVLRTSWGYHPPEEIYLAPYYQALQEMKAIKNRRVASLPWTPSNCDKRLEYPIDVMVMAKAAYPERFAHIDLAQWLLDFYQGTYGVDLETAKKLRSAQWMDWTVE